MGTGPHICTSTSINPTKNQKKPHKQKNKKNPLGISPASSSIDLPLLFFHFPPLLLQHNCSFF